MLQYLIILLDNTSVSYCHYKNKRTEKYLISEECLRSGILYGMKENLKIQFVYPDYELPEAYNTIIEMIDHCKIKPSSAGEQVDVVGFHDWDDFAQSEFREGVTYVLQCGKKELFSRYKSLFSILGHLSRLNLVLTDIDTFVDADFAVYKQVLLELNEKMRLIYKDGLHPQLNILTDRILLDKMNNCNAGVENITLAPNGKFYICPAFYLENEEDSLGNLSDGLQIKNASLYELAYAPLCRSCDAYQCKRCVWLNRKMTLEVNTPSHEQCVIAHLERNVSRLFLEKVREDGINLTENVINEITYLDPFEIFKK